MWMKIFLIIFLLVFGFFVGSASAGVSYVTEWSQIVIADMPSCNLTDIQSACPTWITNEGGGVWFLNASLRAYNSTVYINESEVSTLKWNTIGVEWAYRGDNDGSLIIDGVNVIGWNPTYNAPEVSGRYISAHDGRYSNCTFKNLSYVASFNADDVIFQNIELTNCTNEYVGLSLSNSDNITVRNYYAHDTWGALTTVNITNSMFRDLNFNHSDGVLFDSTNNSQFWNITLFDVDPGLWFNHCNNSSGGDIDINHTGWSSFAPQISDNLSFCNISINNSGHSSMDLHMTVNSTFTNLTLCDPDIRVHHDGTPAYFNGENVMITAGRYTQRMASNITMKNIITQNGGIKADCGARDIWIENVTFPQPDYTVLPAGRRLGVCINVENATVLNVTQPYVENKLEELYTYNFVDDVGHLWETENVKFIDCKSYFWNFESAYGTVFLLNPKAATDAYNYRYHQYSYLDVRAEDATGSPVLADVSTSCVDTPTLPSKNGYMENTSSFTTSVRGRTPKPTEDRSGSIAIPFRSQNGPVYNHLNNITVSKNGYTVTLPNLVSESWYRPDTSISKYSVVAVLNQSTSPHIIGYAPDLKTSLITSGDSVKCRIWPSEQVTSRSWKVNGVGVSTTDENYTYTSTSSNANILYTGVTPNGTITKQWNITPGQLESDEIAPVKKVNTVYINDYHSLWDTNEDGIADILDITLISRHYGEIYTNKPYPRWDINQDGVINIQDLHLAGDHFGETVN